MPPYQKNDVDDAMTDEMFVSADGASMRRGKRKARRTAACRPCLIWAADDEAEEKSEGVLLDLTRFGLRIRMITPLAIGGTVKVHMMRDETFENPLSNPLTAQVVRQTYVAHGGGLIDYGLALIHEKIQRLASRPVTLDTPRPMVPTAKPRMHTLDITVGNPIHLSRGK